MADPATPDLLTLTAQIVAAHVAGNKVAPDDVPALINDVYGALARVGAPVVVTPAREPAVPIKRSIQQEYLVCLEDGAKLKILTRYLQRFGLTPDTYRAKWGLPSDYPMMAPAYATRRLALAKWFGLGTALRTVEQSVPEVPHLPVKVAEPTVSTPDPEHTVASVFANFPGADGLTDALPAAVRCQRTRTEAVCAATGAGGKTAVGSLAGGRDRRGEYVGPDAVKATPRHRCIELTAHVPKHSPSLDTGLCRCVGCRGNRQERLCE